MILLFDIGNSRMHWATLRDGKMGVSQAVLHADVSFDGDDFRSLNEVDDVESIWVANVAGQAVARQLTDWSMARWRIKPHFAVSPVSGFGVINKYREPAKLGIDRWLNLVAAHRIVRGFACVVDCGSAITFDVLTPAGEHLGGLIMPGLRMMTGALARETHAIVCYNSSDTDGSFPGWATQTADAVSKGVLYAASGGINAAIHEAREKYGDAVQVLLTGGDADTIAPRLQVPVIREQDLVLKGLAIVALEGR